MGSRFLLGIFVVQVLFWHSGFAGSVRFRRQIHNGYQTLSSQALEALLSAASIPTETRIYKPPILAAPPPPSSSSSVQSSYKPPLLIATSNDYKPLISSSQTQSVHYQPPNNPQHIQFSQHAAAQQLQNTPNHPYNFPQGYSYSQPSGQPAAVISTSSVISSAKPLSSGNPPVQHDPRQSYTIVGDHSGLQQYSPPSESYNPLSKAVGSSHHPAQAIHKAPASEIQSDKGSLAKDKDAKNDEYIVYYYYYYDNDTTANNNNLSLSFDDIPSLESYDLDKTEKEQEKSASSRTIAANVNSVIANVPDNKKITDINESSQPRSASGGDRKQESFRTEKALNLPNEANVQPLKPISNIYRYGNNNEVPKFPILPNFIVTEPPVVTKSEEDLTSNLLVGNNPTTQSISTSGGLGSLDGPNVDHGNDDENVVEEGSEGKAEEEKTDALTTTSTTSTDPPTTTEIPTTTSTERSRRRPGAGGRRRFNPSSSFSSNRSRQPPTRAGGISSTTTTTTTTRSPVSTSTRGSFRGSSRTRPRPPIGSNRPRPTFSRITPSNNNVNGNTDQPKSDSTTSTTTTTTAKPRYTTSSSRRFSSSRTRSQTASRSSSTTSTTSSPIRARTTSRPRPNLITRNRPPRPGFFRPRPVNEPEEPETTTPVAEPVTEELLSSNADGDASSSEEETESDSDEIEETSNEETEVPTTTEKSRFSALFRPRNRSPLGNRPRPVISSRPSRSR